MKSNFFISLLLFNIFLFSSNNKILYIQINDSNPRLKNVIEEIAKKGEDSNFIIKRVKKLCSLIADKEKDDCVMIVDNNNIANYFYINHTVDITETIAYKLEEEYKNFTIDSPRLQLALKNAVLNDEPEEIKKAVEMGADINFIYRDEIIRGDTFDVSPIELAFYNNKINAFKILLNYENIIINENMIHLRFGTLEYGFELVKKLNVKYSTADIDSLIDDRVRHLESIQGRHYGPNYYTDSDRVSRDINLIFSDLKNLIEFFNYDINRYWYTGNAVTEWMVTDGKLVKFFLNQGADPNYKIDQGNGRFYTPLFRALELVQGNYLDSVLKVVETLIVNGADVNLASFPMGQESTLQSPLTYLQSLKSPCDKTQLIELLEKHGAK